MAPGGVGVVMREGTEAPGEREHPLSGGEVGST